MQREQNQKIRLARDIKKFKVTREFIFNFDESGSLFAVLR